MSLAELKEKVDAAIAGGIHPFTEVQAAYPVSNSSTSYARATAVGNARMDIQGTARFIIELG